jgi:hypothetical protein
MQPSEWPTGIPVLAKLLRRQARQCVPILRTAIERLAAESENAKAFDVAIAAFLKERRKSADVLPNHGHAAPLFANSAAALSRQCPRLLAKAKCGLAMMQCPERAGMYSVGAFRDRCSGLPISHVTPVGLGPLTAR